MSNVETYNTNANLLREILKSFTLWKQRQGHPYYIKNAVICKLYFTNGGKHLYFFQLISIKQFVYRNIKNRCDFFKLNVCNKTLSGLNSLNGVLVNVEPSQLQKIGQCPLGSFLWKRHTQSFDIDSTYIMLPIH